MYEVIVNARNFKSSGIDGPNDWCFKMFGPMFMGGWQYYFQGSWMIYVFDKEEDATMFKLAWL